MREMRWKAQNAELGVSAGRSEVAGGWHAENALELVVRRIRLLRKVFYSWMYDCEVTILLQSRLSGRKDMQNNLPVLPLGLTPATPE